MDQPVFVEKDQYPYPMSSDFEKKFLESENLLLSWG
jgi:hypothetical protein